MRNTILRTVNIGLEAWIIQDGNYPDFEVGKEYRFALQCYVQDIEPAREPTRSLTLIDESNYRFSGQILLAEKGLTVLDSNVMCYEEGMIGTCLTAGQWVSGRLYLGIDPFFWFERHALRQDVPELRYSWLVSKILLNTTPWEESVDGRGRKTLSRANVAKTYRSLLRTDAWNDDGGRGDYIFQCELLGG